MPSSGPSQYKLYIVCLHICPVYVYPLTRLVIRKYGEHVRSYMIAGCRVCSALYIEHARVRSLWLRLKVRVKASRHLRHQPANSREGAVRQQLFVYLDLTCNYICDRLRRGEKGIFASARQPIVKGRSLPPLITVVRFTRAIATALRGESGGPTRGSFRSSLCVTQLLRMLC